MAHAIKLDSRPFTVGKVVWDIFNTLYVVVVLFRLQWLKSRLIKKLNKKLLTPALEYSVKVLELANMSDPAEAKSKHDRVKKMLFDFRQVVSVLESRDFYKSPITEKLASQTLDTLYDAERIIRYKAFDDNSESSENLLEAATTISVNTLSSIKS